MFQSLINKAVILIVCTLFISSCAYMPGKTKEANNTIEPKNIPEHYHSAISAAKKGKTGKAIQLFSDITKNNPAFSPAHTNLGLQYLKTKKYKQAEKFLTQAVNLNPDNAIAYNHLGIIMRIKGEFSNAQNMYKQAIKSNALYANAHLNLGILLDMYLYELTDALEHYESYQALTNNNDKLVSKWIIDIKRQIKSAKKKDS